MAEHDQAVADYRESFRRAARPGYDPHEAREFFHPFAGGPVPRGRARRLVGRLHGMRGTVASAGALIAYALKLAGDDEVCTFFPGYSASNPDFGVMAGHRDGSSRLEGAIRFGSTGAPWWEADDSTKGG